MITQEQTNFIISNEKDVLSSLLRLCSESKELTVKGLAVKALLGEDIFNRLDSCIDEIHNNLKELVKSPPSSQNCDLEKGRTNKGQQTKNSNGYQAIFHGSPVDVAIAMTRYERRVKQRLFEQYSSVISPVFEVPEELKSKIYVVLFDLLLTKVHKGQGQSITELDLSASFRWFMANFKVGLRQLNRTIHPYLPQFNWFLSKCNTQSNNTLGVIELLMTYKALCINQGDKQENRKEVLVLVETLLTEIKQEFNEKDKWFIQNQESIEQERLYAELFE